MVPASLVVPGRSVRAAGVRRRRRAAARPGCVRRVAACEGGGSATAVQTSVPDAVTVLLVVAHLLVVLCWPGAWSVSRPALLPGPRVHVACLPLMVARQTYRSGVFCSALLLVVAALLMVCSSRRPSGAEDWVSGPCISISVYARRRAKAGLLPPALAGAASGAQRTRRVAALEGWHQDPWRQGYGKSIRRTGIGTSSVDRWAVANESG